MSDTNPVTGQQRMPARRALAWMQTQRWYMQPEWVQTMRDMALRSHSPDFEAVLAKQAQRLDRSERGLVRDGVALISVHGPIFRYANIFTELSGAESIDVLATDLQAALDNPAVRHIVLWIDSPGGQVNGTSEFAQQIHATDMVKPVTAYVGNLAASAGYWLASSASRIVIGDTAMLGSIGVVTGMYVEDDETFVEVVSTQSPGKRPDVRTTEGRAQIQAEVDALADVFVKTVARNRDVSVEKVLSDFGKGGILVGQAAVDAGMADEIGSLEGLLAELAGPTASKSTSNRSSSMSTKKGPVTVASTADLQAAFANGHTLDEISVKDFSGDIAKARAEGVAEGEKNKAEAVAAAKLQECERIKAVEGAVLPGHETLIATLKFDGKTTGPEAAAQVITAERAKLGRRAEDLAADAAAATTTVTPPPAAAAAKPKVDPNLPVEDRCKAEWQHDPQIRADFGNVEEYIAYTKATEAGHVRVLRDRTARK